MSGKFDVYDETVEVMVLRDQTPCVVSFCEIRDGDVVYIPNTKTPWFTADGDAHYSGDTDYDGWIVGDENENYFPEDFGARLVQSKD